jgi:hypothetical protein
MEKDEHGVVTSSLVTTGCHLHASTKTARTLLISLVTQRTKRGYGFDSHMIELLGEKQPSIGEHK